MYPSRSHRLIHVINNCEGRYPIDDNTIQYILYIFYIYIPVSYNNKYSYICYSIG